MINNLQDKQFKELQRFEQWDRDMRLVCYKCGITFITLIHFLADFGDNKYWKNGMNSPIGGLKLQNNTQCPSFIRSVET